MHEGCHAQKKGVAPHRALSVLDIQTEKSEIRTRSGLRPSGQARRPVLLADRAYPGVTMNPYDVLPRVAADGAAVRAQFPQLYRPRQSVGRGHGHSTRFAPLQLSSRPVALRSLLDLCGSAT